MNELESRMINVATAGTHIIIAAEDGKKIIVRRMIEHCSSANTLTWKDSDGNIVMPPMDFDAKQGLVLDKTEHGWIEVNSGKGLSLQTSSSGQVSGKVYFVR